MNVVFIKYKFVILPQKTKEVLMMNDEIYITLLSYVIILNR